MLNIGLLCSGNLGYSVLTKLYSEFGVQCILTDKASKNIIQFAKEKKIPFFAGNPRKGRGYNFLKNIEIDVVASINYLFLIEKDIIEYPKILSFNIHGSLLPKYRGRTPHVWAIINGESKAGITAHLIDEGCDTGNIIEQIEIPISDEDTGGMVLEKYVENYYPLLKSVLRRIECDTLELKKQDEQEATYFGKRTPDDGEINWDWEDEKIRNWVRAQAFPYPGAFTYCNGQKVIIDKVVKLKESHNIEDTNGLVVAYHHKIVVKVKNGLLALDQVRNDEIKIKVGDILGHENR